MLDGMTEIGGVAGTASGGCTRTAKQRPTQQRSLKSAISCQGVGVHSGKDVSMILHPAPAGHGIVFRRTDLDASSINVDIPARFDLVTETMLCSTIENADGVKVATIEHLMSALYATGLDNALIEIDGAEVPVMDGSAEPFVFLIECAGVVDLEQARKTLKILKPITVEQGQSRATLMPSKTGRGLEISLAIDFDSSVIGRQALSVNIADDLFAKDISRARTFGFMHEVEALRKMGLAQGGSLENAVVIDGDKVLNDDGLRYDDEFVRHKILDCFGDLALAGAEIIGDVTAERTGHALNNQLLRALFADPSAYELVDAEDTTTPVSSPVLAAAE